MVAKLSPADLLFLQLQVLFGSTPPAGTPFDSLLGLRGVDGTSNNISHVIVTDQFGHLTSTDVFGNSNQPFIHLAAPVFTLDPLGFPAAAPNYAQALSVVDSSPRVISNLIADMMPTNPAVPADAIGNPGDPVLFVTPFNSFFTFFGQFFDHGLDFITKGGSGTVSIPLFPGDSHYINPADPAFIPGVSNVMFLSRATVTADPANPGGPGFNTNTTAPLVDQSQTYGSTAATLFYLMEYDALGNATGRLVTHADGGMATWADIKANALHKGVTLVDTDIFNIPDPITHLGTGQMFLADINPFASPTGPGNTSRAPDLDNVINTTPPAAGFYDNELLNAHYVAGDPRANENVALTAIHEVFHNEHNRLVLQIKDLIAQQDQVTPGFAAQWSGDQIFQAAKLVNEMQYQHIVFEEFARRMSPNITAFAQYNVELNPNITTEFSQAIFRLGHSMLTDSVNMINGADQASEISLVQAFLNPVEFGAVGAADIVKGATSVQGNQIDEFVVDSVRNFLVGQPLDLAALNIARGRDVGLPSLNVVRADIFIQTGDVSLAPYTSWDDFGANLLHPGSLVNFIAAYSHDSIIVAARANGELAIARTQAALDMADSAFMSGGDTGYNDIDLWIGGLAEQKVLDGGISPGMLGSTFDFIFANQMLALQNGDRLYYIARLGGTNIFSQIDGQTFGDMVERGSGATHTNGDIFGTVDQYIELSTLGQTNLFKTAADANAVVHEVIGGTNGANTINAGAGNDTIWGEGGNDNLQGGLGRDHISGGDGNDIINDIGGDDVLRGDAGDDIINGGIGLDILVGGTGNDTISGGQGADEMFGGTGNDILNGDEGDDAIQGNEGNDIINGGLDNDGLEGGIGNDVLNGGAGNDTLAGNEDDDFLIGGPGADLLDGGLGNYDIASYETANTGAGVTGLLIDMVPNPNATGDARGDTFIDIEEVRGTNKNDFIFGDLLNNVLVGNGGDDTLDGRDGNDTLIGGAGNDTLIGGLGIDTAVFLGTRAQYNVGQGIVTALAGAPEGVGSFDTFLVGGTTGIEFLRFADQIVSASSLVPAPMISLSNTTPLTFSGGGIVGTTPVYNNFVNTFAVLDGTALSGFSGTQGINVATILIAEPGVTAGPRVFALAGVDAAAFQVVNAGALQELHFTGGNLLSTVNYEAKPFYHVTVSVSDANGASSVNYTLNITDVNDNRALITSSDQVDVQENTATNVVVYRMEATDVDVGSIGSPQPQLTYSLVGGAGGQDNALFTMLNGEVVFKASPNFELPSDANHDNVYNILVGAFDGVGTTTKAVAITVTNVVNEAGNLPPTFNVNPPASILWQENKPAANVVWTATATDPNNDTLTYTLTDGPVGTDAQYFSIDHQTGAIRFNGSPNYEAPFHGGTNIDPDNLYKLTVNVSDGTSSLVTEVVSVQVTDIPGLEAPVFTSGPGPFSVVENTANTTAVTTAAANGIGGSVSYSLALADLAFFNINSLTGELFFNLAPNFEDPHGSTYNVTIKALDSPSGSFATEAVTVNVQNVNEPPVFSFAPAVTWAENSPVGNVVFDATAVDPENDSLTYTLVNGGDSALFSFIGHQLKFINSPDFENPLDSNGDNFYDVTITVTAGVQTITQNVHLQVTDVVGLTVTANADINGTSEPDTLTGGASSNTINGFGGNDLINGAGGIDTMVGGTGNDTYFADVSGDIVTENVNEGIDLVHFTSTTAGQTYTLSANVENLTLDGTAAINGTGNALANVITGNGAANILAGLDGADTLNGLGGVDTVTYAASPSAVNVSLATGLGTGGHAQGDILSNIENLTGSIFNDTLEGNAGNNVLNGGAGIDTVSYANATAGVTVSLATTALQNTLGAGSDTLSGFENLTGSGFNDVLIGSSAANVLIGGVGNDSLTGGGGADTLTGGLGNDQFVYTAVSDSAPATRDTITDFVHGVDKIVLTTIDANTVVNFNQAFLFGGQNANAVANSVTWFVSGTNTIVQADNNGNTVADISIILTGINLGLTALDFSL